MFMENLYSRYKIHLGNAEKNLKISYDGNTFSAFTYSQHGVSFQLFEEDKGLYKDKTTAYHVRILLSKTFLKQESDHFYKS